MPRNFKHSTCMTWPRNGPFMSSFMCAFFSILVIEAFESVLLSWGAGVLHDWGRTGQDWDFWASQSRDHVFAKCPLGLGKNPHSFRLAPRPPPPPPPHALGESQSETLVPTLWRGGWQQCPGRRGLRSFPVFKFFFFFTVEETEAWKRVDQPRSWV